MDVFVQSHALAQVAAYLQTTNARSERVGPFLVGFTPHTASPWLNYAVPVHGARPTPAEVEALIGAFDRRGLRPRLEYLPGTAPEVEPALLAAGFTVEGRPPVLACAPADLRRGPEPDGIGYELATGRDALHQVLVLQHEAYGEPAGPTPHDLDRIVRHGERGGLTGLARHAATGAVVGAGQTTRAVGGVAELASVAVAAAHRRRGIAAGVSAFLTRTAFEQGAGLVWLEAAGPGEQQVYERVGYREVGEKLYLSRP